jgi:hypothetical protein
MSSIPLQQASTARILVAISFHFDGGRLGYLADVLRTLSEFPVNVLNVVILTNSFDDAELALLRRLCAEILPEERCTIRSEGDLASPWDLTWRHKSLIVEAFLGNDCGRYTHFIYLEGDIRLTFINFCYWVQYRELLRGFGLLPAYLRLEWSTSTASFVMSDVFWPVYVPVQSHQQLGDMVLVSMPNPYNPWFILDDELAREYIHSPSFDIDASKSVSPWATADRSAMGLCLEHVPPPFPSRYVVPVSRQTGKAPSFSWVSHLPNNYANNPQSPLGKLPLADLFTGVDKLEDARCWGLGADVQGSQATDPSLETGLPTKELSRYYYLISEHDTVLYVDEEVKRIRHAPFGVAPLNLVLDWVGTRGRLMIVGTASSGIYPLSFVSPDGEINTRRDTADLYGEINYYLDDTVSIRIDGMYLGAEWEGVARNNKTLCHQWERYRLVRADMFDLVALMRHHSWLSHSDRRIVSLADQPFDFGREQPTEASALAATIAPDALELRRALIFGPARLQLTDRALPISIDEPTFAGGLPRHLSIRDPAGAEHHFSRFAPLVRYTVEGANSAYQCLCVSLTSLARYGRYRGVLCIVCDRPRNEVLQYVPAIFHGSIVVEPLPIARTPSEGDDLNGNLLALYQPVLLCSPDTLFTCSIVDVLINLLLDGRIAGSSQNLAVPASTARHAGLVHFRSGATAMDDINVCPAMQDYTDHLAHLDVQDSGTGDPDRMAGLAFPVRSSGCVVVLGNLNAVAPTLAANVSPQATVYCINAGRSGTGQQSTGDTASRDDPCDSSHFSLPNVILLHGNSPQEIVGWQREIDLTIFNGISNPELRTNLTFWSRFVRPGGSICGLGYANLASDIRSEICLLAKKLGASIVSTDDTWCIVLPPERDM